MNKIEYLLKKISYQLTKFTVKEKDYFEALDREYAEDYKGLRYKGASIIWDNPIKDKTITEVYPKMLGQEMSLDLSPQVTTEDGIIYPVKPKRGRPSNYQKAINNAIANAKESGDKFTMTRIKPDSFKKDVLDNAPIPDVYREEPWTKKDFANKKGPIGPYKIVRVKPNKEIADTIKAWCVQRNVRIASISKLLKADLCLNEEEIKRGFNYLENKKKGAVRHLKPWGRPTLTFIFNV